MADKKVSQLTAGTSAEITAASLIPVVIDPGGSPGSRKVTLEQIAVPPASWLDELAATHTLPSVIGGDFSVGMRFAAKRSGQTCTGVRFYWNDGASKTIRCTLWKGGVAQKTVDVSVNAVGYYTGWFASSMAITRNEDWYVSIRESGGSLYELHVAGVRLPAVPVWARDYVVVHAGLYAAGNAQPSTSVAVGANYAVEPLVTG